MKSKILILSLVVFGLIGLFVSTRPRLGLALTCECGMHLEPGGWECSDVGGVETCHWEYDTWQCYNCDDFNFDRANCGSGYYACNHPDGTPGNCCAIGTGDTTPVDTCSPSVPGKPTFNSPVTDRVFSFNTATAVNLIMNSPSSWGELCDCGSSNRIKICASSQIGTTNPCRNMGTGSTKTVKAVGGTAALVFSPVQGTYTWTGYTANKCGKTSGRRTPFRTFRVNLPPVNTLFQIRTEPGTVVNPENYGVGLSGNHTCQAEFRDNRRMVFRVVLREDRVDNITGVGLRLRAANGNSYMTAVIDNPVSSMTYPPTPTPYPWAYQECSNDADCEGGLGTCSNNGPIGHCPNVEDQCLLGVNCEDDCVNGICTLGGNVCTSHADCPSQACLPYDLGDCIPPVQPTGAPIGSPAINPSAQVSLTGQGSEFFGSPIMEILNSTDLQVDFPIEFGQDLGVAALMNIEVFSRDNENVENWTDTNRELRVWDCMVPVSGTMFDGSGVLGGPVCGASSFGYSIPVTNQANFARLVFQRPNADREMSLTPPASYSSVSPNHFVWGGADPTYTPWFGENLLNATSPLMRIISLSTGVTSCSTTIPVGEASTLITPYADNIALQVDFSTIVNQEQWFQVHGGGVLAREELVNNVPITCPMDVGCSGAIALEGVAIGTELNNGIIMGGEVNVNSGCGGNCMAGNPNNWMAETPAIFDSYDYEYFYSRYHVRAGKGIYYDHGVNMSQVVADTGSTGVVFIDGNLNIDVSNSSPTSAFFMLNVNGDIVINNNVDRVDGVLLADGSITTPGESNNQLAINGIVYSSGGNVRLNRGYINHAANNTAPSVVVSYRPRLLFNMPGEMVNVLTGWREGM